MQYVCRPPSRKKDIGQTGDNMLIPTLISLMSNYLTMITIRMRIDISYSKAGIEWSDSASVILRCRFDIQT